MAFEQEIVFKTVVDDNGVAQSFAKTNELIEETNASATQLNSTLDKTMQPRNVGVSSSEVEKGTKAVDNQTKAVKKSGRGLSTFTRVSARASSSIARFAGLSSSATSGLGRLAQGLASTPFGPFALAATAASIAYSFFTSSVSDGLKEIEESANKIGDLNSQIKGISEDNLQLEIDLSGLTESEKAIKRVAVINAEIADLSRINRDLRKEEIALSNEDTKTRAEEFKRQEKLAELDKKQVENRARVLKLTKGLNKERTVFAKIEEDANNQAKRAAEQAKKDAEARNKLIASLVRDELQKKIAALEEEAKKREKEFKDRGAKTTELNSFIKESQKVLGEDIAEVRANFDQQRIKAERAVQAQLISDEEEGEKKRIRLKNDKLVEEINALDKSETEKAALLEQAETQLQTQLQAITDKFAAERVQKEISVQDEIFEVKLAATEAEIRRQQAVLDKEQALELQAFQSQVRTEEEITDFNKKQADEKLKNELFFQIERLRIAKEFNKQLTEVETAALDAQIEALKVKLTGVGGELKKAATGGKSESKGLFGLLGLSDKQVENTKAIQGALEQVTSAVSQAVAQRVQLLDEEVQRREANITKLEGDLNTEIRLRELGKASNVKQVQSQLAEEKAARDQADREKEKAAKAQFILDTALQASNMATAISALYASLSELPFGTGVAIATVLSGVMLGAFVSSKASAAEAAGFAEGGYFDGVHGYTGPGGKYEESTKLGNRGYTYHKDEYIIPSEKVDEYGLANVPVSQLDRVLGGHFTDSTPNPSGLKRANKRINKAQIASEMKAQERRAIAVQNGLKSEFANQNKILNAQLRELKNTPSVVQLSDKQFRIKTGNKTEIINLEN